MKPFELAWMTTEVSGTPHAKALAAANPGLEIHCWMSREGGTEEDRQGLWRNCDRHIREYWRANRCFVEADEMVFFEWDVYCNVNLLVTLPKLGPGVGIAGAAVMSPVRDVRRFWPFEDIPRLPREMQGLALGVAPAGVLQMSREALDAVIDERYDGVFAADVFCEVRLPTVVRHAGFGVAAIPLPGVDATPKRPGSGTGIWHPVKGMVS